MESESDVGDDDNYYEEDVKAFEKAEALALTLAEEETVGEDGSSMLVTRPPRPRKKARLLLCTTLFMSSRMYDVIHTTFCRLGCIGPLVDFCNCGKICSGLLLFTCFPLRFCFFPLVPL